MKYLLTLYFFLSLTNYTFSQDTNILDLIEKGIRLHEKGNFHEALSYYDIALNKNPENFRALAEKGQTMSALGNHSEAVKLCKKAYKAEKLNPYMKSVFITWGNSLDEMGQQKQALGIYEEGISKFPDSPQLYLNKGITLTRLGRYDRALKSMEKTIELNPYHANAHNLIGRLNYHEHPVQSILAFSRFLLIEFEGARAEENLQLVQSIFKRNTASIDVDSSKVNISIPEKLIEEIENTKCHVNDFKQIEMQLSLLNSLDFNDDYKKKDVYNQFAMKLDHLLMKMAESKKDMKGFYWDYYAPYFIEMKEKGFLNLFSHLIFLPEKDPINIKWLAENEKNLDSFYEWDKNYSWN